MIRDSRCVDRRFEFVGYRSCGADVVGAAWIAGKLSEELQMSFIVEQAWKGRP